MSDRGDVDQRWRHGLSQAVQRAYEAAHGHPLPDQPHGTRWEITPRVAVVVGAALAVAALLMWWPRAHGDTDVIAVTTASPVPVAVVVHVTGDVHGPGVVELTSGARVGDAIEAAGGFTATADTAANNLARVLHDGEQIHVPTQGEERAGDGRVNLNRASASELEALPGIGPALAARIVDDRERNGPFGSIEDLARVSGVGSAIVGNIGALADV